MNVPFCRAPLALALAYACAHADETPVTASLKAPSTFDAPPVIVTANPLGSSLLDMVQPADALSGPKLRYRLEPTLGETLANETGVSSSYFGPNASRPIIRGLDGERVRILQNGATVLDASGASPDHAVATDPFSADRIEIVRGPAALLYGTSAIGGVVNAIDNRIASAPPEKPFGGEVQVRLGGAADERSGAVKLEGGDDRFALHVDAFRRETSDLRIPGYARSARLRAQDPLTPPDEEAQKRLPNSASTTDGLGVGGTAFFERGYVGASVSNLNSNYGTVAEPDVTIDMRKTRYDLAGEVRELGFFENAKFRVGYTDYTHTEFEGSAPGTVFNNKGYDARVDLRHRKVGRFEGAFGLQSTESKFEALGDEAFVPPVTTRTASAFIYEEAPVGPVRLSAGGRVDSVRLSASEALPNFSPAESRSYSPFGGSLGGLLPLGEVYAIAANASYTERAPNYAELFANGPHVATGQFEVGNREQNLERSMAFDLALRKRSGTVTGSVGVFAHRFSNFIALLPTGTTDAGSGLPISQFEGVRANFRGVEAEARFHAIDTPDRVFHVDLRADYTHAENASSDTPLPRIAPLRVTLAGVYQQGGFGARVEAIRASAQNRVAPNELPTDGYTLVNARLSYGLPPLGIFRAEVFLRANNLLNEEVRYQTSILKDVAPLGARSVMVGVNGVF